jgi:hypothetical protein
LIFDCARRFSFVEPAAGRGIGEPSDRASHTKKPDGFLRPAVVRFFVCAIRLRFAEPAGWRVAHGQNQIGPTTAHPRERQLYGR